MFSRKCLLPTNLVIFFNNIITEIASNWWLLIVIFGELTEDFDPDWMDCLDADVLYPNVFYHFLLPTAGFLFFPNLLCVNVGELITGFIMPMFHCTSDVPGMNQTHGRFRSPSLNHPVPSVSSPSQRRDTVTPVTQLEFDFISIIRTRPANQC